MKKVRLDQLLFDRNLVESRERAKTTIMTGIVYVNGQKADKPGTFVAEDCSIEIRGNALPFVSRGGFKLDKAIKVFNINPENCVCIDCGASTGGFTDVLLQNGAAKVYAVDVGYGQLAWKLRNNPKVINIERTNVRYIDAGLIPEPIDLAVMDVSFISIKLVLPAVKNLLKDGAGFVCLIKPQFEAGREEVGKKGVVHSYQTHVSVCKDIISFCIGIGYSIKGLSYSPIKGPEGNVEFLLYLINKADDSISVSVEEVVTEAHMSLQP